MPIHDGTRPDEPAPARQISKTPDAKRPDAQHASKAPSAGRHRPLRILHLMVLVAAVALTIYIAPALTQAIMRAYGPTSSWNRRMYLVGATSTTFVCWTGVLMPLSLLGNRRRRRRAARCYGNASVLAAGASLCLLFAAHAFNALLQIIYSGAAFSEFGLDYALQRLWQLLEHAPEVSGAIVAVWVVLALTGAGRKPSNWLEILRLIFGVLWVVWYFVHYWMFFADLSWLKGEAFTW